MDLQRQFAEIAAELTHHLLRVIKGITAFKFPKPAEPHQLGLTMFELIVGIIDRLANRVLKLANFCATRYKHSRHFRYSGCVSDFRISDDFKLAKVGFHQVILA